MLHRMRQEAVSDPPHPTDGTSDVVTGAWCEVRGGNLIVPHLQSFARRRDECSAYRGNVAQTEQLRVEMISSR